MAHYQILSPPATQFYKLLEAPPKRDTERLVGRHGSTRSNIAVRSLRQVSLLKSASMVNKSAIHTGESTKCNPRRPDMRKQQDTTRKTSREKEMEPRDDISIENKVVAGLEDAMLDVHAGPCHTVRCVPEAKAYLQRTDDACDARNTATQKCSVWQKRRPPI